MSCLEHSKYIINASYFIITVIPITGIIIFYEYSIAILQSGVYSAGSSRTPDYGGLNR